MKSEFLVNVAQAAMFVFLVTSMLELGLTLRFRQLWSALKDVRLLALSLLANFVVAPLLALAIVKVMRLELSFATGLILLGLAPGAPFIPKVVNLARANLSFAVGLMVVLMAGTVLFLPFALPKLIPAAEVNTGKIVQSLCLLMGLPLLTGLVLHEKLKQIPGWVRPGLGAVSNLSGLVVLTLIVALNFKSVLDLFGTGAVFAGVLFVLLSSFFGWVLAGPDRRNRNAVGFATGLRNVAAALLVGAQNFKDPKVNVMVLVSALIALFVLLPVASFVGHRVQAQDTLQPVIQSPS